MRKERKLTTAQLSAMTGISEVYIRQIEGQGKIPSLDFFVSICNAVGADPLYLLQDSLEPGQQRQREELLEFCNHLSPRECEKALTLLRVVFDRDGFDEDD